MQITPERWKSINEVFEVALELEGHARAAFLDEACAGDPLLRAEVLELIASHERAGSFLAAPAFEPAMKHGAEEEVNAHAACRIGSYETIREIGRGGMGTVYLAARADEAYRKQVAIKVVKRGMDTEAVVRGFRKERQILADLDHPHIARLLDGGTTDNGLPYFVMDYIEGLPLDVHCDTRRLSVTQRLELFRTVCSAVEYAHQHGVIHRDLKPGNILVTEAGAPKLLDFGIAKVLNPEVWSATVSTTIARPLTPAYASPEQVRGEEITPVSDIYSLGVILYELLAGHRPYRLQSHTPQELERVICEQEPEKPSTIVSRTEEIPYNGDDGKRITITPASVSAARDEHPKKLRQRLAGDLDNIVLMALRKEPDRRYVSVEQFSDDIRRHLESLPVIAHKDTLSYRTAKFVRRHSLGVMTAAPSLMVALALIGFVFYSSGQVKRTPDEIGDPSAVPSQQNLSASATTGLTGDAREQLTKRDTDNPAANREYLMGGHFRSQQTAEGLKRALHHFERAVELDPRYALAHAGQADSYLGLATYRVLLPREAYANARAAAAKALELNPSLSEAHLVLASVSLYHDWDWIAAEQGFQRAIQLRPDNANARMIYALALAWFERFDEALREIEQARELDPLLRRVNVNTAMILYFARRNDEATAESRRALALDPNFFQHHQMLGWTYVEARAYEEAIAAFKKALELGGGPLVEADLAHAYAVSGQTREARKILNALIDRSTRMYISSFDIAVIYAGLGDRDQAFGWLEKAYDERVRPILGLKVNPRLDPLRSDARFADLMRRMRVFGN